MTSMPDKQNMPLLFIMALGLNMHFGYTGLLNFGQAGFLAIGAYSVAVPVISFGLPLWVAFLIGIVNSVIFALILGIPTLRLRADYLAIVTLGFGEIAQDVLKNLDAAHPGFADRLLDENGALRKFVNVFVSDDDVRYLDGMNTAVPAGETVSIIPAVAGG